MQFTQLALATLAILSSTIAAPTLNTRGIDNATIALAADGANGLLSNDLSRLRSMGMIAPGINSYSNNGKVWIGADGYVRAKFTNYTPNPIILVLWVGGSWVNTNTPLITYSLATIESVTLSFSNHVQGGAFSAVYTDTTMIDGQIANTWGEFTTNGINSVDNISMLPNMRGHKMTIINQATGCRADWLNCVFQCTNGANRCGNPGEYFLKSCDASQHGGTGIDEHKQPSGGCQMGDGGNIDVIFLQ
jgi:hypothetical protein